MMRPALRHALNRAASRLLCASTRWPRETLRATVVRHSAWRVAAFADRLERIA